MDFTFTEEQQMLLETTRRFIQKDYGFEARRKILRDTPHGHDPEIWQGLADIGLLALNVPEQHGGMGGNALDTMLAMQAMGEGLVLEPYLANAVLATHLLAMLATQEQQAALLPGMAAGEKIAVLAHDEPSTRFDWQAVKTSAARKGTGYVLSGHKSVVSHAANADVLLVSARLEGSGTLGVFAVPSDAAGLRQLPYRTVDGSSASEVWLEQVAVDADARIGGDVDAESESGSALADTLDWGLMAVSAEAVGALDKILAATVEYGRTRKQFGQPIARFQALQHKMADMVLHIEQARSMSYLAAVRCTDADLSLRRHGLSSAKVVVGQACRFAGQQAVQLHGGMGVTDELDVSHYFKRLMAIELQFGSTDTHLERVAAAL